MRRTTLGPISSSQLNTRPPSVLSHPSARVSIGPGGGGGGGPAAHAPGKGLTRQSVGTFGSSRRVSIAAGTRGGGGGGAPPPAPRLPPSARPRSSVSRQSVGSAAAAQQSRRSSLYSGRNSLALSGRGANLRADPRPLTDRNYMTGCIQALLEFLGEHQYNHALSPKLLKGPSKKDFCNIVLFLFREVDPTFEFGVKIEDDVAQQFKVLRYPFQISRSALAAVGSPHTWPALLGTISWFIELLNYNAIAESDTSMDDGDAENGDKVFFKYLSSAYRVFLAGDDEQYNVLEQQEAQKLGGSHDAIENDCTELERANEELKQRIEQARNAKSTLPDLTTKKADCTSDLEKFRKLVRQLKGHQDGLVIKIQEREAECANMERELQERQNTIKMLHTRIENQELSSEDVEQMTKERERLNEHLNHVAQRQKEMTSSIWQKETYIAEQINVIENHVQRYTNTATGLKMIPTVAKNARGVDYEISLDIHTGGLKATKELCMHLKQRIRPAIMAFKQNRLERSSVALDEALQLQNEVEKSQAHVNMEYQHKQTLEGKARKLEETVRREREMQETNTQQKLTTTEDVELRIESILNGGDISVEEQNSVLRLEGLKKAYAAQEEMYKNLWQKYQHEITNAVLSCAKHKELLEDAIESLAKEVDAFTP